MGTISEPVPVKLIMPMISGCAELFETVATALTEHFGPIDYRSPRLSFTHTTYYDAEFGLNLERCFLSFETLIDPGRLATIKVLTNMLEQRWAEHGHRRINLDPGYISQSKLILATTKNHSHRVYIGQGIYAEVTLAYRNKDFRPWTWTYPDYRTEAYLEIMRTIREVYISQLRALRETGAITPR